MEQKRMEVVAGLANVDSEDFVYTKAFVDTSRENTLVPLKLAIKLGIKTRGEEWIRIGHSRIKAGVGDAKIILNGHLAYTTLWISEEVEKVEVGIVVLEQLGLKVNAREKKLEEEKEGLYSSGLKSKF